MSDPIRFLMNPGRPLSRADRWALNCMMVLAVVGRPMLILMMLGMLGTCVYDLATDGAFTEWLYE